MDISEIRRRVGLFLPTKDTINCARVCKDWAEDFLSILWHTIEDPVSTKLVEQNPAIISKHGHRIRAVKGLTQGRLCDTLQDASVSRMKSLSVTMVQTSAHMAHIYDILRRNSTTLTELSLAMQPGNNAPILYLAIDPLCPHTHTGASSKLFYIKLEQIQMTRNSFSMLLKMCPLLKHIEMTNTILGSAVFTDMYQHPCLSHLTAPVQQVFRVDPNMPTAPTLLVHFPKLTHWTTWQPAPTDGVDAEVFNKEITKCCPLITSIHTREGVLPLAAMLVYGFKNLTEICISHKHLSDEIIMAMVRHQDTLVTVMTPPPANAGVSIDIFRSDQPPAAEDYLGAIGWAVQMIPRHCLKLKKLSFPTHAMCMEDIDMFPWVCEDLQVLHIRFKGLDTIESIDEALNTWIAQKKIMSSFKSKGLELESTRKSPLGSSQQEVPIAIRVSRHLLAFKKLHTVWLGSKEYHAL